MKVLIAGGTGVLGSALAQQLVADGLPVTILVREPTDIVPKAEMVKGDVRKPNLGLSLATRERLQAEVTHVVSTFGSVDLDIGPQGTMDLHGRGTEELLRFFRACADPVRYVHASSILIFGKHEGEVGNRDLFVGQRFRNWYEVGKFAAERILRRAAEDTPVHVVRLGPVLGADGPVTPSWQHGLVAGLPYLLKQWPVPLHRRGQFPCYVSDATAAAKVLRYALDATTTDVWTYFDPRLPSLNQTLTALCEAWGILPRILDVSGLRPVVRLASRPLGLSPVVLGYLDPWVRLAPDILADLPFPAPPSPPQYLRRTSLALRKHLEELMVA